MPLDANERRKLDALIDQLGEYGALQLLRVNRHALARVLSNLPVRRGTVALFRTALASIGTVPPQKGDDRD